MCPARHRQVRLPRYTQKPCLFPSPESPDDAVLVDETVGWEGGGEGSLLTASLGCRLLLEMWELQSCWENVFDTQILVAWGLI